MANHHGRPCAAMHLERAKPDPLTPFGNRQSAIGNSVTACPICRKPFEMDEEVGPVPACECGTRGKVDPLEEGEMPYEEVELEGDE